MNGWAAAPPPFGRVQQQKKCPRGRKSGEKLRIVYGKRLPLMLYFYYI